MTLEKIKNRDAVLFDKGYVPTEYIYVLGVREFSGLGVNEAAELLDNKLVEPESRYGNTPTFKEFYDFMTMHPGIKCQGFAFAKDSHADRKGAMYFGPTPIDDQVVITGVNYNGAVTMEMLIDFVDKFRGAPQIKVGEDILFCDYR